MENMTVCKVKLPAIVAFAIGLLMITSCRITLVPPYDAAIMEHIEETAKAVDKFYLMMLETSSNADGGRDFENFAAGYVKVEVELNSLLNKNKIRPLNENTVRICEITLELWIKRKEEHRTDNELSDGLIKLNRKTFEDLFFAMQVAEKSKEIISNPPN
ncbi:MAG: hypothetical protein EOM23_03870 [Candidatus Moranbacteria bacterium]|nr:hypothetical protein [Candidatus Moranbacteria bacterium]